MCIRDRTVIIPRIPLIPSDYRFQFKRLEFPVMVFYAMTINKAQGLSFIVSGVDLRSDCFSPVSYTHLDVYKRQVYMGAIISSTLPFSTDRNLFISLSNDV